MIAHTATLSIGRVLLGIGAAIMNVAFGKMITETVPDSLVAKFAMAHNASICIGLMPAFGLAAILPDTEDLQANKDDELWRVIWLAPAVIGIIVILLTVLVFRQEPVSFCLMEGRDEEGIKHLKRIYRKKRPKRARIN